MPIALRGAHRYILAAIRFHQVQKPAKKPNGGDAPQIRDPMRAEVERLVEEIKQSVGLLRRHL
jgi:hypothetical protein